MSFNPDFMGFLWGRQDGKGASIDGDEGTAVAPEEGSALAETLENVGHLSAFWSRLPVDDEIRGHERELLLEDYKTLVEIDKVVPEDGNSKVAQYLKNEIAKCDEDSGGDESRKAELRELFRKKVDAACREIGDAVKKYESQPE